jgi:hypothetical protein
MLDYRTAIDAAFWAAVEADTPLVGYFKAGLRQKQKTNGWLKQALQRAPNDFPSISFTMRGEPSPPQPPRVFGMQATSYTPAVVDFSVPLTLQAEAVITAGIEQDTLPIEAAVDRVLWAKWPTFGLSYCTGWSTSTTRKEAQVNGVRCKQVTKLLTFNLRPQLSQLVAT